MNQNNNNQKGTSIFNQEPFNTKFNGYADAEPVNKAYDPAGSGQSPKEPKNKKNIIWNTVGIAVIILLLIGISTSISANRKQAQDTGRDLTPEELEQLGAIIMSKDEGTEVAEDTAVLADRSNTTRANGATPSYAQTTTVKLAMLADPQQVSGPIRGCDAVYMIDRAIIPTRAPLNAALRELFKKDVQADFLPGNFLATQTELQFVNATIDNGIANVYLTGQVGPYEDACDQQRAFIQIDATTRQFATVRGVNIYLDGKKLEVN